jgi:MscS family membrane protein
MKSLLSLFGKTILDWSQGILGTGILFHAVAGLLIFILALIAGRIIKFLLDTIGRKIIQKTESDLDDKILEIVLDRIMPIVAIAGMYFGLREFRTGVTSVHTSIITFLSIANGALYILIGLVLTIAAIRIVETLITHAMHSIAERGATNFDQALTPLVSRVVNILIVAVAVIVILDHFGQNISTLLVSLGVGSLAIALAAQETISNMIAGFVIMIDRPFRVGDRVKMPNGDEGDIYEIGVRSTKILDFDNNLIIMPNSELVKTRIINYSYPETSVRVVVEVTVNFGSDIRLIKHLLVAIAKKHPAVLKDPPPEAYLIRLGEYGLQFKLFCRVGSYKQQFAVGEELRISVVESLRKEGVEIPLPKQVLHIEEEKNPNAFPSARKRKNLPR